MFRNFYSSYYLFFYNGRFPGTKVKSEVHLESVVWEFDCIRRLDHWNKTSLSKMAAAKLNARMMVEKYEFELITANKNVQTI